MPFDAWNAKTQHLYLTVVDQPLAGCLRQPGLLQAGERACHEHDIAHLDIGEMLRLNFLAANVTLFALHIPTITERVFTWRLHRLWGEFGEITDRGIANKSLERHFPHALHIV